MIIGFMGKGGSGKTTMSTLFTRHLVAQQQHVLAIDADHNMDFLFNLAGEQENFPYLGSAGDLFARSIDLQPRESYQQRLTREPLPAFTLSPRDAFTESVSRPISQGLRLMAAGPHTEEVRQGSACSHILAAPLKAYLPLLHVSEGQAVVVDSTAGMDMVGTGIAAGMDIVCICTEPTIYGTKTAKQIAEGLDSYRIPHVFVLTKMQTKEQRTQAEVWLGESILCSTPFTLDEAHPGVTEAVTMVFEYAKEVARHSGNEVRRDRAIRLAKEGVDFYQKKT